MYVTSEQKESGYVDPNKSKIRTLLFWSYGQLWLFILAAAVWGIGYMTEQSFAEIWELLLGGAFVCLLVETTLRKKWDLHWQG